MGNESNIYEFPRCEDVELWKSVGESRMPTPLVDGGQVSGHNVGLSDRWSLLPAQGAFSEI